jgi:predicted nucleotidyltransferase
MPLIVQQIKPILEKYGVKRDSLFGSYARGDHNKESDVDILIEPPNNMGLSFIDLKLDLEESLSKKVDLLSYRAIDKYLKEYILNDVVQIL